MIRFKETYEPSRWEKENLLFVKETVINQERKEEIVFSEIEVKKILRNAILISVFILIVILASLFFLVVFYGFTPITLVVGSLCGYFSFRDLRTVNFYYKMEPDPKYFERKKI